MKTRQLMVTDQQIQDLQAGATIAPVALTTDSEIRITHVVNPSRAYTLAVEQLAAEWVGNGHVVTLQLPVNAFADDVLMSQNVQAELGTDIRRALQSEVPDERDASGKLSPPPAFRVQVEALIAYLTDFLLKVFKDKAPSEVTVACYLDAHGGFRVAEVSLLHHDAEGRTMAVRTWMRDDLAVILAVEDFVITHGQPPKFDSLGTPDSRVDAHQEARNRLRHLVGEMLIFGDKNAEG